MNQASLNNQSSISGQGEMHEEMDYIKSVLLLWYYRNPVLLGTICITVIGLLYAILATPTYRSQTTIVLKEPDNASNASRMLAQFGAGAVVPGMGSSGFDRIELILKSRELAEAVIIANNLLPRLIPDDWDDSNLDETGQHQLFLKGVRKLRKDVLGVSLDNRRRVINISATTDDAQFSKDIVQYYLTELNERLRNSVMEAAHTNREYLESQLNQISDPQLRLKILTLIGMEVEKEMLVNSQAFDILIPPVAPEEKLSPKRKKIVILFSLLGLVSSVMMVFMYRAGHAMRLKVLREARSYDVRIK